jgi:amidophosphoribosyltransferase
LGHNRYATNGSADKHHQPVEAGPVLFTHNGNLPLTPGLEDYLSARGINFAGYNDSEMMGRSLGEHVLRGSQLPDAVAELFPKFTGAFSCVALGQGPEGEPILTGWRDRHGVRPLSIGKTATGLMIASETSGLEAAGATFLRDVEPAELVVITPDGIESHKLEDPDPKFDMFELIYFSRPDSMFRGVPIEEIRRGLGRQLAFEYPDVHPDSLVIGIPSSAVPFGKGYADALGLEYQQAITRNPAVGRTFMAPTQRLREELRDKKYDYDAALIRDRNIVAVDDSIVRKTTGMAIVRELLARGARSVTLLAGSPPVRYPNFYGIDTPEQNQLAAARMSLLEMKIAIGCKRLGFLSLDGMTGTIHKLTGEPPDNFELSCFTGEYIIPIGNQPIVHIDHRENAA